MISRKAYCLIAAALIAGAAALASGRRPAPEPQPAASILNETLTNSMSGGDAFKAIDREVREFMRYWGIQGISLSVMRNDSLMFSKGYGWADKEKGEEMTPRHILRMASVSKLITAVGIMKLWEQGRLSLGDKVFGPEGILCYPEWTAIIKDSLYYDITIEHLLRHQGGFSTKGGDPMFSTRSIMVQNRLSTPPDHGTLVRTQLGKPLAFVPGETQEYSNFGFLLLSMVIEAVTGTDYENWMQENVLKPAGCMDFHIVNNYYSEKYPNEVHYYVQPDDSPVSEYNNSGRPVVRCYGGNDIRALSGAGAWAASTAELCRFVATIDGRPQVPDIISVESVRRMTEWFDRDTFSLGWNDTKPTGEWTRTGTFSGTSALVKYFPDGECWVLITNTSTWRGSGLAPYTTEMFEKSRAECSDLLPRRNLFYVQ
jgi:CubicO group peptidase (beta-lactamase class C family)